MTPFAIITPDRGDRPEMLSFCRKQMDGKTHFVIDYKPVSAAIDLVPRVIEAIRQAKEAGFDFVFIVENDDYYHTEFFNYFEDLDNLDFVGCEVTQYYNLKNRTFQRYDHPDRSSLFCTGFRISALDRFQWPNDDYKWLDVRLWEYANRYDKRIKLLKHNPNVGIKGHGLGLCAGKGHVLQLKNSDPDLSQLKEAVSEEAFEFYKQLMEKI